MAVTATMDWWKMLQWICSKVRTWTGLQFPHHIAIIMDGNRRFARRNRLQQTVGYRMGFTKLWECLKWCLTFGVREVTVYAFSIENFKRPNEEVNIIMDLIREKIEHLLSEIDQLNEEGIQICFVGRLSLLSPELQSLVSQLMLATKYNTVLCLNITIAYTGRDEISRAASLLVDSVQNRELCAEDIDEHLITEVLELGEPDLLIRTSGETRLSDFMLWQISHTALYFTGELWPEFTFWNFLKIMLHYMMYAPKRKAPKSGENKQRMEKTTDMMA